MSNAEVAIMLVDRWLKLERDLNRKDAMALLKEMVGLALSETYRKGWLDHDEAIYSLARRP